MFYCFQMRVKQMFGVYWLIQMNRVYSKKIYKIEKLKKINHMNWNEHKYNQK